ncbi:MAG: type II toxin-antitoxin system RelE/ParE family toxin [Acidobacteriota bacterium]
MPTYSVEFTTSAEKEFVKLPAKVRSRVAEALTVLSINPFSELLNIKKLKGVDKVFRIRLGDYRIVYEAHQKRLLVIVIKIGNRREVYRRF